LLRRVRDFAQVRADGRISGEVARQACEFEGVDEAGLDGLDRELLRALIDVYGGGPVGIDALAATLNEEAETLQEVVEPFLLKRGFLSRTPGGRKATAAAYEHLRLSPPERGPAQLWQISD